MGGHEPKLPSRLHGQIVSPSSIWPPSKSTETWNSAFTSEKSASADLHPPSTPSSFSLPLLSLRLRLLFPSLSSSLISLVSYFAPLPTPRSSQLSPTLILWSGLVFCGRGLQKLGPSGSKFHSNKT